MSALTLTQPHFWSQAHEAWLRVLAPFLGCPDPGGGMAEGLIPISGGPKPMGRDLSVGNRDPREF